MLQTKQGHLVILEMLFENRVDMINDSIIHIFDLNAGVVSRFSYEKCC